MEERKGIVTMKGRPLTLLGPVIKAGDQAPDFTLVDNELRELNLKDFESQVLIVSAVPSLDTPVCDMETRRFNTEAASLSPEIKILTVSMDLPFAQKRWCGAAGVDQVMTLSDHRYVSFGMHYGVLIKELRLLAREVFVLDSSRIVKMAHLVKEVTEEPDYDSILEVAKGLI